MLVGGAPVGPNDSWLVRNHVFLEMVAMVVTGLVLGLLACR